MRPNPQTVRDVLSQRTKELNPVVARLKKPLQGFIILSVVDPGWRKKCGTSTTTEMVV